MSSQGGKGGGQKWPILLSKKTTKRAEGVKNCWFCEDIVYGRSPKNYSVWGMQQTLFKILKRNGKQSKFFLALFSHIRANS